MRVSRDEIARALMGLIVALLLPVGVAGQAPHGPLAMNVEPASSRTAELLAMSNSLSRGGYAVVVDLDRNELSFMQGTNVLWTAPVGTGTGLRLETDHSEWDFGTPNGVFQVQYKEENPTWIAPDWFFVENGLPIPPRGHKSRYFPGGLGAAAVYIGHDLAIHGTDKPELLGQRVSHGCIRLSNEDAQRLFHNVQIGTEVLIVGGEDLPVPAAPVVNPTDTFNPQPAPRPTDPLLERWKRLPTDDLSAVLSQELWMPRETTRWSDVAHLLVTRGMKGEIAAFEAVLAGVADLPSERVESEYRTFLMDIYSRSPMRTLEALAALDRDVRDRAAMAIVMASAGLFSGELDSRTVPWPTSRVPRSSVGREGRTGWNALARAEERYRDRREI